MNKLRNTLASITKQVGLAFNIAVKYIKIAFKATVKGIKWFFTSTVERRSLAATVSIYILLVLFGFVYIYPLLYMIAYSFMGQADVVNPLVNYIPTKIVFTNYADVLQVLVYGKTLFTTLYVSLVPALLQTVSTSLIAYALSRFEFKLKKLLLVIVLITFIVPQQVTMIPQVIIFTNIGIIDTVLSYFIPALFGQGIRSAIFVLIFYQFFSQIPKSLEESAKIDGANTWTIFWSIGVRSALPAYILTFLLSFVWYYNETTLATIYLGNGITTLTSQLLVFESAYKSLFANAAADGKNINEAIYMAGTVMTILPLILIYFFTQRFFVEGIDKAGITGE